MTLEEAINKLGFNLQVDLIGQNNIQYSNFDLGFAEGTGYVRFNEQGDENNKKGIYAYLKKMNSLYLLAETPQYIKDKEDSKVERVGNKMYGINATAPINAYARDRLKDFMLKPVEVENIVDGERQTVTVPNVMTWWNRALLEEARQWNPDGNFDRISAMGMLMLYREEKLVLYHGNIMQEERVVNPKANDPFFERNYPQKGVVTNAARKEGWKPSTYEHINWE